MGVTDYIMLYFPAIRYTNIHIHKLYPHIYMYLAAYTPGICTPVPRLSLLVTKAGQRPGSEATPTQGTWISEMAMVVSAEDLMCTVLPFHATLESPGSMATSRR